MENPEKLISKIKEKKSLSGISDSIIKMELENYLKDKKISLFTLSPKDEKIIIKDLRQRFRRLSGSFQHSEKDSKNPLLAHSSTKERMEFYPELKKRISFLSPKSILDLGSGVNPLAIAENGMKYHAYDINERDLSIVSSFFESKDLQGYTKVCDLRQSTTFPVVDLCIMFKVLDILDVKNHKLSEELLKKINAKNFLISFSTKTLSGAPMRHPQRGWIERLLTRLGFKFESFSSKNEIFYLAHK